MSRYNFKYNLNPKLTVCGQDYDSELLMVVIVCSSPKNLNKRNLIRKTWAHKSIFKKDLKIVFLLGDAQNKSINEEIRNEYERYLDVVQENFVDSYRNLSLKTIMGFKWVAKFCQNAKYVLKIDDDVVVNTYGLIEYFGKIKNSKNLSKNFIFGICFRHSIPVRNKTSKFYVSYEEFNGTFYDPYCIGFAYVITNDLVSRLYQATFFIKPFVFEDVYVGMLAKKISANFFPLNSMFSKKIKKFKGAQNKSEMIRKYLFVLTDSEFEFSEAWNYFVLEHK